MTDADLTRLIVDELRKVAPEADTGFGRATGVEVPEADYGKLATMEAMVRYFRERRRADVEGVTG